MVVVVVDVDVVTMNNFVSQLVAVISANAAVEKRLEFVDPGQGQLYLTRLMALAACWQ